MQKKIAAYILLFTVFVLFISKQSFAAGGDDQRQLFFSLNDNYNSRFPILITNLYH